MKLRVTFKNGINEEFSTTMEIEEETMCELIKDKTLIEIFRKEKELEKKYNKIMRIVGIKDIDNP